MALSGWTRRSVWLSGVGAGASAIGWPEQAKRGSATRASSTWQPAVSSQIFPALPGLDEQKSLHYNQEDLPVSMPAARDDLHDLIDRLPEAEVESVRRFLESLAPEPVGPEFAASIRRGIEQVNTGKTILCHDYEEMVEQLLDNE